MLSPNSKWRGALLCGVSVAEANGQLFLWLLDGPAGVQVEPPLKDVVGNVHVLLARHVHRVQNQKVATHPENWHLLHKAIII